jgi:hypothetical protein
VVVVACQANQCRALCDSYWRHGQVRRSHARAWYNCGICDTAQSLEGHCWGLGKPELRVAGKQLDDRLRRHFAQVGEPSVSGDLASRDVPRVPDTAVYPLTRYCRAGKNSGQQAHQFLHLVTCEGIRMYHTPGTQVVQDGPVHAASNAAVGGLVDQLSHPPDGSAREDGDPDPCLLRGLKD